MPDLSELVLTDKATRAASLKASLTPRFFIAEHSGWIISKAFKSLLLMTWILPRYRNAFMFCATCRPCLYSIMGLFGSVSAVASSSSASSLKSHFSATSTIFTPGQFSSISCFHLVSTFSNDCGESTWEWLAVLQWLGNLKNSYRETKHYGVGVVIWEWPQSVEFFLSSRVP